MVFFAIWQQIEYYRGGGSIIINEICCNCLTKKERKGGLDNNFFRGKKDGKILLF